MTTRRRRPAPQRETFTIVGRRAVVEALRAGRARSVSVARNAHAGSLGDVLEAAEAAGVPVERVEAETIASRAGGLRHQGAAAEVALPPGLGEGDLERRSWGERARVLVLDGVADPHNLGACARTAEAAGVEALVIRRDRSASVTAAAVRASAGALLHMPVASVANIPRALGRLRAAGFWAVGLDGDASTGLDELAPSTGRVAVVLGAEDEGLSRLVREACDELVAIPMRGRVASLNVSVAAGVALFHPAIRTSPDG